MTEAKAKELLGRVLARVKGKDVAAAASLTTEHAGNTRFAQNAITSSADVDRTSVGVTVQIGLRSASATTNQLDDHALDEVVARAIRMARLAPENPEAMPVLGKQTYVATKGAVDAVTAKLAAETRAKQVGAALGAAGKLALAGFYEHALVATARASTAGLWAFHETTSCGFSCTARTADATGSGWAVVLGGNLQRSRDRCGCARQGRGRQGDALGEPQTARSGPLHRRLCSSRPRSPRCSTSWSASLGAPRRRGSIVLRAAWRRHARRREAVPRHDHAAKA